MGRIDDSLLTIESIEDNTERALQLAGLISTLFKIKGVILVVTGQTAFEIYANAASANPELELAAFAGKLAPRLLQEIMGEQLRGRGLIHRWSVAGIPVRFQDEAVIVNRDLCRDFMTDHGVVKLLPVEEITTECILAAIYPAPDAEAQTRARLLLINGLTDAFHMNWQVLHALCHRPEYRVGEELAQMRLAAKKDVDAIGGGADHVGVAPPQEEPAAIAPEEPAAPAQEEEKPKAGISASERAINSILDS